MSLSLQKLPLLMDPAFSERPWGGKLLQTRLGKQVPEGKTIGESWELSDHPNGRSKIANGQHAGREFGDLMREFPMEMLGVEEAPDRYPLLVKMIDAAEDLSIQVHPSDATAPEGDRGKTECWYVVDCEPGTEVVFGLHRGLTPDELRNGAIDGSLEQMVRRHKLERGDFLFVRAGTVHAILGGTLICEIQQSSDTTYRLWDWNRKPAREIHVEESLEVIDWDATTPAILNPSADSVLTENEYFGVDFRQLEKGKSFTLDCGKTNGVIVCCVAGEIEISAAEGSVRLSLGQTAYLPVCLGSDCEVLGLSEEAKLLLATSSELGS